MTLGLLPLEKVPVFIWGLILMLAGGFLMFQDEFLSLAQVKAIAMCTFGAAAIVYDLRKRFNRSKRQDDSKP